MNPISRSVQQSASTFRWLSASAAVAMSLVTGAACAQYADIDRLVVFGTSLSDPGNSFVRLSRLPPKCGTPQNVPPYAALLKDPFAPMVPDGPYAKGGHHVSNGSTWAEGVAQSLALAGNGRPALQSEGVKASNYAVLGARAIPADAADPCPFWLPQQVGAYLADFPQTSPRTLVAIEIGSNDVRDALLLAANPALAQKRLGDAVQSLLVNIGTLYGAGARKFLVLNVADIGITPSVRMLDVAIPGLAAGATQLSIGFNDVIDGVVLPFMAGLPGVQVRKLDVFAKVNAVRAKPGDFGFTNVTDPCVMPNTPPYECSKPDTYLFWDGIHPTRALHAILAGEAVKVILGP